MSERPQPEPTPKEASHVPLAPGRVGLWREIWAYLRVRKKWWLGPMLVILLALGALAVFTETSALAPFIYTLF